MGCDAVRMRLSTVRTCGGEGGVVVGRGVVVLSEGGLLARRHVVAVAEGAGVVAGEGEGDAGIALGRRGRVVGRGSAREAQQGLAGHTVVAEEGSGEIGRASGRARVCQYG